MNWIRHIELHLVDIAQLQRVNNKFTRTIYFWLDNIIIGFITEFAIDTTKLYIVAEKDFMKGTIGRYIRSLYTSIKILLYEKGVMTMESYNKTSMRAWGKGGSTNMSLRYG
jgi:hypothetical protein